MAVHWHHSSTLRGALLVFFLIAQWCHCLFATSLPVEDKVTLETMSIYTITVMKPW